MASKTVTSSIILHPDFCLDKLVFPEDHKQLRESAPMLDPHLEMGGGSQKNFFFTLLASVWSKNKEGGVGGGRGPGSANELLH